ncbi:MAG: acyl carrier protein [Ruminococcaceae bacterium]|nr:acyl carrier protein [Oscillospiraceae bacterium]
MEELIEILEGIDPDHDYENSKDLIDAHKLSSLSIISLVAELEEEFDVTIPATQIVPENFNSADAMLAMIRRLEEADA